MAHQIYHNTAKKSIIAILMIWLFLGYSVYARTPNDPFVSQWSYTDTKLFEAWDLATGSSDVVVAIIDNGFDTFHPELIENAWKNVREIPDNGIDDDKNGYVDDVWGWNFVGVDADGSGGLTEEELKGNNDPRPEVTNITPQDI